MKAKKDFSGFKSSQAFPGETREDAQKYIFRAKNGQLNKDFSEIEDFSSAKRQFQLVLQVFLLCNDQERLENLINLNYNYDIHERLPKINRSMLEFAVYEEKVSPEILKFLIEKTATKTSHSEKIAQFEKPLHWAAQSFGPHLPGKIKILIENGANINTSFEGKTALQMLVELHDDERRNNVDSIKTLIDHGAVLSKSDIVRSIYKFNGPNNSPKPHRKELAKFFEEIFGGKPRNHETKNSRKKSSEEEIKKTSTPQARTRKTTRYVG